MELFYKCFVRNLVQCSRLSEPARYFHWVTALINDLLMTQWLRHKSTWNRRQISEIDDRDECRLYRYKYGKLSVAGPLYTAPHRQIVGKWPSPVSWFLSVREIKQKAQTCYTNRWKKRPSSTVTGFTTRTRHKLVILHPWSLNI